MKSLLPIHKMYLLIFFLLRSESTFILNIIYYSLLTYTFKRFFSLLYTVFFGGVYKSKVNSINTGYKVIFASKTIGTATHVGEKFEIKTKEECK